MVVRRRKRRAPQKGRRRRGRRTVMGPQVGFGILGTLGSAAKIGVKLGKDKRYKRMGVLGATGSYNRRYAPWEVWIAYDDNDRSWRAFSRKPIDTNEKSYCNTPMPIKSTLSARWCSTYWRREFPSSPRRFVDAIVIKRCCVKWGSAEIRSRGGVHISWNRRGVASGKGWKSVTDNVGVGEGPHSRYPWLSPPRDRRRSRSSQTQ